MSAIRIIKSLKSLKSLRTIRIVGREAGCWLSARIRVQQKRTYAKKIAPKSDFFSTECRVRQLVAKVHTTTAKWTGS